MNNSSKNDALNELSKRSNELCNRLVSLVAEFYRGQHSAAEDKTLRTKLTDLLASPEIFKVVKSFAKLPESVYEKSSNIWESYGERRNAELYSTYGLLLFDCSITVTTESGEKKKTKGAYIDNFNIEKCPDGADDAEIANRLLTHLAKLFRYAVLTEKKDLLRKKERLPVLSLSDDDVSNDEDNIALAVYDDDHQATAETLDEYLGGFPRLVTAFLEKHKKIRTKVPLAPMFYTEELIRVLQDLPPEQFKDEYVFHHEAEVFECVPRSWLDYLMSKEGIDTYKVINATRLKYWSELFGDEPFGNITKEKWNSPIPLVQKQGGEPVPRLNKDIYADYLKKNDMENVAESRLSDYHRSFNAILDTYRKKYIGGVG